MKKTFLIFGVMLLAVTLMAASCNKQESAEPTSAVPAPGFEGIVDEMIVNNGSLDIEEEPISVQNVSVKYSDSGFRPATITINKGDTVTFTNTSSGDFRPASNPHPIHIGLIGFDAKRAISPNGSYGFSFNRTGTFKYHNHLSPTQGGTVIVK